MDPGRWIEFTEGPRDRERDAQAVRRALDLVTAFAGGGYEAAVAEIEHLMNEDFGLAVTVMILLTALATSSLENQAASEGRELTELLLDFETRVIRRANEEE